MKKYLLFALLISQISCKKEVKANKNNDSKQETIIDKKEIKTIKVVENKEDKQTIVSEENLASKKRIIDTSKFDFNNFKGFYVGSFVAIEYKEDKKPSYSNKINISLDSVQEDKQILFGHSVVAGNIRPFIGKYKFQLDPYMLTTTVREPGNDKYDGVFEILCYYVKQKNNNRIKLSGNWKSYDKKLSVTERKFDLDYKNFWYNPNQELFEDIDGPIYGAIHNNNGDVNYEDKDFDDNDDEFDAGRSHESYSDDIIKFNASNRKLNYSDIENFNKGDLEITRNSIYARHGYSFKNRKMRYFFDEYVDWYIPVTTDVRNQLTQLEKDNIKLLKRYEKHAEKYYDYFGR
jgi:hypothetical protein